MALYPIPRQVNLELNRKHRAEKKKRLAPIKVTKSPEVAYRRELHRLTNKLHKDVMVHIVPLLMQLEAEYVGDAYANTLEQAFNNLRIAYVNINNEAKVSAAKFVTESDQANKKRFYKSVENAVGVNLSTVVQNEGIEDILVATTRDNVNLIRSISEEHFKKIENIVFSGTTQGREASSMINLIIDQGKVSYNRAKVIARDQSSKLNSALTRVRSTNLGIEEYIWRTAGDGRVRETHKKNNGKVFRWDTPSKETGHPGADIQCRCAAQPIIKL